MSADTGTPFNDPTSGVDNSPHPQLLSTSRQSSSMTLGGPTTQPNNGSPSSLSSWAGQISASLSTLGEQIAAVSQLVPNAQLPALDSAELSFAARLDGIEQRQTQLEGDLSELRRRIEQSSTQVAEGASTDGLTKKVDEALASFKLEQSRLYPRLLNATVTVSKMPIKPLPTSGGKPPPNFPATRGEFEHLTKERYDDILKAYGIPSKGDTAAKRETLRAFLGLPP